VAAWLKSPVVGRKARAPKGPSRTPICAGAPRSWSRNSSCCGP